jgi:hypothetical protein
VEEQGVESCDIYIRGKFVGRSYASSYFVEGVCYDEEQGTGTSAVIGEFYVLSVSPLGVRQRMTDAARVVVKW